LLASLESALSNEKITISSPEFLMGRLSGIPREVDVAIHGMVGSSPVLVIMECRDRSSVQGVDWIQEVATKREDVGAHVAVVVSASAFSPGASSMARSKGILLRRIRDCRASEILGLFATRRVLLALKRLLFTRLEIFGENGVLTLRADVAAACRDQTVDILSRAVFISESGESVSNGAFLTEVEKRLDAFQGWELQLPTELPPDGEVLKIAGCSWRFDAYPRDDFGEPLKVQSTEGLQSVKHVALEAVSWVQICWMSLEGWRAYTADGATLAVASVGQSAMVTGCVAVLVQIGGTNPDDERLVLHVPGEPSRSRL
jgi:hypothetical protein